MTRSRSPLPSLAIALCLSAVLSIAAHGQAIDPPQTKILAYINTGWTTLSRSMSDCASVVDIKVTTAPVLYLPAGMAVPPNVTAMQQQCHVDVRHLPRTIHRLDQVSPGELPVNGLLYLPYRYVVPGGRFNEMYGWDSYFILLGLIHDKQDVLAKGMVENFFFEIQNYGAILNANRTYFFTRSQPPFLSSMIREVYEHSPAPDNAWLERAYTYANRDYALWTSAEHRAGTTGLARYFDLGSGPVPEMADDSTYYPDVIRWLIAHPTQHPEYLVTDPKQSCNTAQSKVCTQAVVQGHRLSAAYFRSDRAMRESGFDTSFRFGPFSGSTADYAPVCLNSLLFKYENDMAHFAELLGKPADVVRWKSRAVARKQAIDQYLWDNVSGLYVDYNYVTAQKSTYHFVTVFYPLWVGAASEAQAAAVRSNLSLFERSGGLAESDVVSGVQWDMPFGWAPTTWIAAAGLDRAGFHADAVRIAQEFSKTVLDNFVHDGTMREKYNIADGNANVQVAAGYKSNVVGFGWTNAVYLKLQDLVAVPTSSK
jgi:alpha,alpha-trehalase